MILSTKFLFRATSFFLVLILTACGSSSRLNIKSNLSYQDIYHDEFFGDPIEMISLDKVFDLSKEQKEYFLSKFHSPGYRDLSDSQRVFEFLQDHLENFNFHTETLIATDALSQNAGNCMSLAILTKAISKLTHVGVSYELARTPPVFQREGNLELSSQHIRTVVYNKTTKSTKQFVKPNDKVRIDYFSTTGSRTLRKVKTAEFHSLFYSNRAAEAMINENNELAYWSIKEALKIKSDNLIAINMLGVLYDRIGKPQLAEDIYLYGLSFKTGHLELLNNYHNFLVKSNRHSEAEYIASELENYNDPDPFKWLDLADKELREKNYRKAIRLYSKASELADYLHQPYAGIAKANFELGRYDEAIDSIKLALEHAHTKKSNSIYQEKFEQMQSQIN